MRIIKKAIGKEPEILELEKTEVYSIFDSGLDRRKICKSLYIVDRYQRNKTEQNFNTSLIKSMDFLFNNCNSLESIDLSKFNTTLTYSMHKMFSGCNSLRRLDLSNFNTSSVRKMEYLFNNCSSLKSLNLINFETSLITDMRYIKIHFNLLLN